MFDIEQEVAAWSAAVHADRCRRSDSVAELSDHLWCEIERGRAAGMSDEAAFAAAVAKVGPAPALAAEQARGRSWGAAAWAAVVRSERASHGHRGLFVAHGLVWAAMMIATAAALKSAVAPGAFVWLLVCVLVPGQWASEQLLRRALRVKSPAARG
jgi:hypothetical protein